MPNMQANTVPVKMAEEQYLFNARFHATVDAAVLLIERDQGVKFDASDRSLATLAAAVALVVRDL